MKNKILFICIILLTQLVIAQENNKTIVPINYYGTYIPKDFIDKLNTTNSYARALYEEKKESTYHDILFVGRQGIFSDLKFHDKYKIINIENYIYKQGINYKYIIDENKNEYIPVYLGDLENNYQPFYEFVINTIFQNAKELKNIKIEGSVVFIDNLKLNFVSDLTFFDYENCDLWFYCLDEKSNRQNYYAIIEDGINARLVRGIKDEEDFGWVAGNEVLAEFPIFYYGGDDIKTYKIDNLDKSQIRLLRNLVYAKHGYPFKDKQLEELYSKFAWYKINNSFSESELSEQEKKFVQKCKYFEDKN